MTQPSPIVVAASGTGRSLKNLIHHPDHGNIYNIVGVLTSNTSCKAYAVANEYKLDTISDNFSSQILTTKTLKPWLEKRSPKIIVLAGFLKHFPCSLLDNCHWKVINIHPSLLPKYGGKGMYGRHVHQAVLKAKEKVSGATVHFASAVYDQGEHILSAKVPVFENDTTTELANRVFSEECTLLPAALRKVLQPQNTEATH